MENPVLKLVLFPNNSIVKTQGWELARFNINLEHFVKSKAETSMASEHISTGKSIYGGYYAQDSSGNISRGKSEGIARQALQSAQNRASQNRGKK
ncbi:hypothetical protein J5X98_11105 [Leptothermofonsia sichuanensis E412]|uniref:hypothetical protein n=1 Tax=Leptothermofonsia sichuanensis TaxID=2917832 RepID=UPI001CA63B33|nr:hypothetical protein [Leptothermofonsia sichuanensis]QZZ22838.1 hypothetical protein J5X98_11105 [Leptothermofonsia sichuanensis E412]